MESHCDDTLKIDGSGEEMEEEDEMVRSFYFNHT